MKVKYFFLLTILGMISFLYTCAGLSIYEAIIKGKVKLSDNPSYGHGGVLVSCGIKSTITASDGSYELHGDVFGGWSEITLVLKFQKALYKEKTIVIDDFDSEKENLEVDVGTVVLERATETYTTVFSDDFNRTSVGSNYQTSGNVSIDNGKLRLYNPNNSTNDTEAFIIASRANLIDMAIAFDFDNGSSGWDNNLTYIYLRYIDENNFYRVKIVEDDSWTPDKRYVYIERSYNGSIYTLTQSNSMLLNSGRYEFKVVYNDLTFKNVTGGSTINLNATDDKIYGSGRCGFGVSEETTTFDNIVLSEIEYN